MLDSFGIGEAPDAAFFGDAGASTVRSVFKSGKLEIPNMISLGLSRVEGLSFLGECENPLGAYARIAEKSTGKDTTIGHWEIAGHVSEHPLPVYPDGFPGEIISRFEAATGREVLCNKPYSGTEVIKDYGAEHMRTGALIVYTSADSVFQIAAHEDIVPVETLYAYCRTARGILQGEHGVGRVIARPFTGVPGNFSRSAKRHDFSLEPPYPLLCDRIKERGLDSIAVGKISDIFAHRGFTETVYTSSNMDGMRVAGGFLDKNFRGLCFINLVDFDSIYGHRRDSAGYAAALSKFDIFLGEFIRKMTPDDLIIITADHGCDPGFMKSTDHTREYVPFLAYGQKVVPADFGTRTSFADVAATVSDLLGVEFVCDGEIISLVRI